MTQNKRIDIAIDLETLSASREHLPAVWEVGAVVFDRSRPADCCVVGDYIWQTHPSMAELHGISDWATRSWLAVSRPDLEAIRLHHSAREMISTLANFLGHHGGDIAGKNVRWWAWGAEFDLRILQGLIERVIVPDFPIHYRHVRDARTYCTELSEQFGIVLPKQDQATKHNAIDDARHCARLVTGVTQQMDVIRELAEGREVVA